MIEIWTKNHSPSDNNCHIVYLYCPFFFIFSVGETTRAAYNKVLSKRNGIGDTHHECSVIMQVPILLSGRDLRNLVVKNGHHDDTCSNEIGLYVQNRGTMHSRRRKCSRDREGSIATP